MTEQNRRYLETLYRRIRYVCGLRGMPEADVFEAAGLEPEKNRRIIAVGSEGLDGIKADDIARIAEVLEVSPEFLFDRESGHSPQEEYIVYLIRNM